LLRFYISPTATAAGASLMLSINLWFIVCLDRRRHHRRRQPPEGIHSSDIPVIFVVIVD